MKNTSITAFAATLSIRLLRACCTPFTLLVFMAATLVACGQTGPLLLANDEPSQAAQAKPKNAKVKQVQGSDTPPLNITQ
ncbi:MAG: LptM family lipoprotein [Cellvibrionaceae bacterium]